MKLCNLVHLQVSIFGYILSCTTLRAVGITTRSVVHLSLLTQVFRLENALANSHFLGHQGPDSRSARTVFPCGSQ